jgi:hypothetical protein
VMSLAVPMWLGAALLQKTLGHPMAAFCSSLMGYDWLANRH